MAIAIPRLLYPNRVWDPLAILSASSVDPATAVSWLKDQLRSKAVRTKLGWNISTAFNTKFDFLDNDVARLATLAVNNYATGAAFAGQLTTAMNAAPGITNSYTVTYDVATFKLRFSRTGGANTFGIKLTGVDAASCAKDCGFNLGADKTGATFYDADLAAYHSREWLKVDLRSALACADGAVFNHNAGAGGIFTLQGHTSDAWTAPDVVQVLAGNAVIRIAYFSSAAKQWWRLVIDDVQNTAGYSEVGIWCPSPYVQPAMSYSPSFTKRFAELSNNEFGPGGAHFQDIRGRRPIWSLKWEPYADADRLLFEAAAAAAPKGRNLVLAFDAAGDTTNVAYGFFNQDLEEDLVPPASWSSAVEFWEAMG